MGVAILSGLVFVCVFLLMSLGYILKGRCLIGGTCASKAERTADGRYVCPSCGSEKQPS